MDARDRLLSLIERLYAAPGSAEGWRAFLADLCTVLDGSAASFISHNLAARQGGITATARTDPAALEAYQEHWAKLDPWAYSPASASLTSGAVVTGEQLIRRADLRRTAYYNDFARYYGITQVLAGMIEAGPNGLSVLSINAADSRPSFAEQDVRLLHALMPHLQRALQLHRRLVGAGALADASREILNRLAHGVLVFDARGRLMLANRTAEEVLRSRDGLYFERGELRAACGSDTTKLRTMIASAIRTSEGGGAGAGGVLALGRPSGRRSLRLVVAPTAARRFVLGREPAAAIVFVTDPERTPVPSEDDIRVLFGLTHAEARLARALVDGLDLEGAAERLGVRVGTLRTRLKSIFDKTGAHRQADLVRILLIGAAATVT